MDNIFLLFVSYFLISYYCEACMFYPMILKFLQKPLMKDMLKWVLEDHLASIKWITIVHMLSYFFKDILDILGSSMKPMLILPLFIILTHNSNDLEGGLESTAAPTNFSD